METDDPRAELALLSRQVRGLLELERLHGVPCLPVPFLAPLARPLEPAPVAPARVVPAPVAPAAAVAPAPAPDAPLAPMTEVRRRAASAERSEAWRGASPAEAAQLAARRAANEQQLHALARRLAGCTRCKLADGRTNIVFGQGDAAAEVAFVGEGPGYHEDQQGLAFVGPAGQLLTKMIEAMGLGRDEVFVANATKCRPPGNRTPQPDEMAACTPFLVEQLKIIQPKVICALGKTAAVGLGLVGADESMGRSRGRFKQWQGIPTMLTYHPAYLLRNPADKRKTWEDLQALFPYIERRRRG